MQPSALRDRISALCFWQEQEQDPIGRVELAFRAMLAVQPLEKRLQEMAERGVNLFDRNYRPIPGSHPQKYHTSYDESFEQLSLFEDNEKKESNLIDILAKSKDKRFMFITSKFLFFPRNYYWMYKMYDIVWRSANISKKIDYGKTGL